MASRYPGSLHNHSDFSNLRLRDGISRFTELIDQAIKLKHDVIAITEHECLSNAIKIEKYAEKVKDKIKVIRGNEIYLCRDGLTGETYQKGEDKFYHFILLARDSVGHRQLREISTRAWSRSWKTGKMIRVPTYYQDLIDTIGKNPGHVIGSTACLGGFLGTKLLQWHTTGRDNDFYNKILNWIVQIEEIFGKGNFYLELQPSDNEEQVFVNKEILKISEKLSIPYIITTDSHYTKREDKPIHKAFLNAQEGEREVDAFYATTYLMDTKELEGYLKYMTREQLDYAYQNIQEIKDRCEDYSLRRPLKIPSLSWKSPARRQSRTFWIEKIPNLEKFFNSDFDGDIRMAELIIEKLASDPRLQYQESYDEVNKNLEETWVSSEVNKAHWSAYFLNLQNILDEVWRAGSLVGPGRGSGVGFYLLYLLDLIQINPLWETTRTFSWRLTALGLKASSAWRQA